MTASIMQVLDNTIANVALPRIQGALSATQDQMAWVLTSYIVAAAIMTPMTGWLAGRFGRKRIILILDRRLHLGVDALRYCPILAADGAREAAAGCLRRRARPHVAGGDARHLSARAAREGDEHLGDRYHHRADHGACARRLAHRQLQLALGVLHQRAVRHRRLPRDIEHAARVDHQASRPSISSALRP